MLEFVGNLPWKTESEPDLETLNEKLEEEGEELMPAILQEIPIETEIPKEKEEVTADTITFVEVTSESSDIDKHIKIEEAKKLLKDEGYFVSEPNNTKQKIQHILHDCIESIRKTIESKGIIVVYLTDSADNDFLNINKNLYITYKQNDLTYKVYPYVLFPNMVPMSDEENLINFLDKVDYIIIGTYPYCRSIDFFEFGLLLKKTMDYDKYFVANRKDIIIPSKIVESVYKKQ